jgi:hypothetical protein
LPEEYFPAHCPQLFLQSGLIVRRHFLTKKWSDSLCRILPIELVGSDGEDEQEHNLENEDNSHLFDPRLIACFSMAIDPNQQAFKKIRDN